MSHAITQNQEQYNQLALFQPLAVANLQAISPKLFPPTRYQGSKYKLLDWLWQNLQPLEFETALDAFGGTGCVSYLLKTKGKQVTYNDLYQFNEIIARALIQNNGLKLTEAEIQHLTQAQPGRNYPTFIQDVFADIYFTQAENQWLDVVATNIRAFNDCPSKQALAYFALFQACIVKRPYNLFHRKNLYVREAEVKRSFGNKATWDKPFEQWFRYFVEQANRAVFPSSFEAKVTRADAAQLSGNYDLVYIDPPYISQNGVGVDYRDFYHFLEGLVNYQEWESLVDWNSKHRRLKPKYSEWSDRNAILSAFEKIIARYQDSILVISYRNNGIPTPDQILALLKQYKSGEVIVKQRDYKYVLSPTKNQELLFIALPNKQHKY
jgi:adenine-specific DNA-methyltransferase